MIFTNINYGSPRKLKFVYYELSLIRDNQMGGDIKRFRFAVWYWLNSNYEFGEKPVMFKNFVGINITFAWLIKIQFFR